MNNKYKKIVVVFFVGIIFTSLAYSADPKTNKHKVVNSSHNDYLKRQQQKEIDVINNVMASSSETYQSNKNDTTKNMEYIPVDLNVYGKIAYPFDTITDWNATETDARMDSILKANNVFYKDDVGWVKQKSKNEPISGRILLTKDIQPVFNKDIEGKITVNLIVNENGDVILVSIGSPTSISDKEMRNNALEAAKKLKFSYSNTVSKGSITYNFRLSSGNENNMPHDIKDNSDNTPPTSIIERMPEYPGGEDGLNHFIYSNLKYPKAAKKQNVHGNVIVKFVVTENGNVDNVEISRSLFPECDEEAIRIVKLLVFKPAMNIDGNAIKNVRAAFSLGVKF